jgi:hypothetical protein
MLNTKKVNEKRTISNKIPIFINRILNDEYLPKESRNEFYELFVKKFLNDKKYQESVKGKYILFFNFKYQDIYNTKQEIEKIGVLGDDRYIYRIGDNYSRKNF